MFLDYFSRNASLVGSEWSCVTEPLHPAAPHHLPSFIVGPADTDYLMIGVGIFLISPFWASAICICICTACRNEWRTNRKSCNSKS